MPPINNHRHRLQAPPLIQRLHHLIMVDPWGMAERPPPNSPLRTPMPLWIRVLANAMQTFNPLSALRAAGPYG